MPRVVAFIPARGGSKSIPKKNIKQIYGRPLIYWTAGAAAQCPEIEAVYVATDDPEIAHTVDGLGLPKVRSIGRSAETATDVASTESALLEFAEATPCDMIVLIQATSPLLTAQDIAGGLRTIRQTGADSLLSTVEQKRFIWRELEKGKVTAENYDPASRPRRQDFSGYLVENGAFYIMGREGLLRYRNRLYGNVATWKMEASTFVEIDEPDDWDIVEHELAKRHRRDSGLALRCRRIKLVLTDVDGVLTDAGMYYSESGDELKKFNTRDGQGAALLRERGFMVGVVTAESTQIVARRAKKLGIDILYQGVKDKKSLVETIAKERGLALEEIAYIGDDVGDLDVLGSVGLSACPRNAIPEVKRIVAFVCEAGGGEGAFREFAECIIHEGEGFARP